MFSFVCIGTFIEILTRVCSKFQIYNRFIASRFRNKESNFLPIFLLIYQREDSFNLQLPMDLYIGT